MDPHTIANTKFHFCVLPGTLSGARPTLLPPCSWAWRCGSHAPQKRKGEWLAVLVDALTESLSIALSHLLCYARRNLNPSILFHDVGIPSMSIAGESADIRCYFLKASPLANPQHANHLVTPTATLLPAHNPRRIHLHALLAGCTWV
jgi:hypothetical protein